MGVEGVLDGQRVQPEGVLDLVELVLGGVREPDPDEVVAPEAAARRLT